MISVVCCIMATAIATESLTFYLAIVGLGAAAMPMYSVCIAYANDRLEPHQIVGASGSQVSAPRCGDHSIA